MNFIKNTLLFATVSVGMACNPMKQTTQNNPPINNSAHKDNPLFQKSNLQYQAPRFDLIKDEHFKPAFEEGLKIHDAELNAIANNKNQPTFENTLLALEKSGELLGRSQIIFYNLTSANTNPNLQKIEEEYAPIFAAHSDKIFLNSALYNRIKSINTNGLDAEDKRLREVYLEKFEIAGAALPEDKKEDLKKINQELATLSTQYSNKLLEARKNGALLVLDKNDLDGLSEDEIAAAAKDAEQLGHTGKYLLNLLNTTQQPLLQKLNKRSVREMLYKASWNRAEKGNADDTRTLVEQLAKARLKKAQLLGKSSFSEWKLQDQMAKTPDAAMNLLAQLAKPSVQQANVEAKAIQELIDKQGGNFKLEPWDWNYYAEQVRKEKYDLNDEEIMPYFEVRNVLEKGVFYAAEKLYGITFKERKDLPVYHPDVVAYEVFDHDSSSLAIYYLDFYTRSNKNGGAWMSNFVEQSHLLQQKPVIVNVFNYQKPAPGRASLISYDDVETMFHEFGHSIHGIFADQKYVTLSGTNVPRDFVEFPSQINEHWALDPVVLKNYALHYETGKPMPQSLIDKIKKAKTFNEGYMTTELVAAATLDMAWHSVTNENQLTPALQFEPAALEKYGLLMKEVPPRYHTPYFAHIWGGGYSAGYYAYLWSETLDADAYDWISHNGGLTRANGDRFRKYILSVGNSKDLNEAYKDFTGRKASITPLLKDRGFVK